MNKAILCIGGSREGKKLFQRIITEKLNYKAMYADPSDGLQEIVELLGWNGVKDQKYQDFYNQLFKLANSAYNFKTVYVNKIIEDFWDNNAQILFVKGSDELSEELKGEAGIVTIFIARNADEFEDNRLKYDKVIMLNSSTFEESVKNTIDILTKEKEKEYAK